MRTCVALLFVSVMVVLATAEGNKNEKNVEEWTSRVGRGTPNRNKVNLKRDRKRIKPTRQRNGPGRRSKKINHKISKPGVRVEISNRGNLQRTKNFENVKATLKQKNPPFPACSYLDFGKITAEGKDCSKDGYKFVVKGPTGVRKQFLHVDDRVILAFVATGEKFATCTKFEDITGQVECKIVGGLAGTILNTKKDLKKADNFDACSYLDLGQITVQGTDCSNDGYKFVVKGKPKGVRKQFLHVDNKVIVAFVAPGDDNKFANCPAFQDITAQVTCTKVDGLAGTKLDNVVSGSEVALIIGGQRKNGGLSNEVTTIGGCSPNVSPLPQAVRRHATAVFDGSVYSCGGENENGATDICYRLKSDLTWEPAPTMTEAKLAFGLVTFGSKLVAVGGKNKQGRAIGSIEVLEQGSSTWTLVTSLIYARYDHSTSVFRDRDGSMKIMVVGGIDINSLTLKSFESLTLSGYFMEESIPGAPHSVYGLASQFYSESLTIIGGWYGDSGSTDCFNYLPRTFDKWIECESKTLNNARYYHSSALLNGELVVFGGINSADTTSPAYVESYETVKNNNWISNFMSGVFWTSASVITCN